MKRKIENFLGNVKAWGIEEKNIISILLVGSYANGSAKENSDIDIIILTPNPDGYLQNRSWLDKFGKTDRIIYEEWGLVRTVRAFYRNGFEAEFNFSTEEWAKTNPVDTGTKKVMAGGYKIIIDKTGIISSLIEAINLIF
ncbi:MAG TPA: nucleotidyltransferase domain-containing protein [Ignavibacteria bacterium]|jgi:predicted nucleotidyltransferase